MVAATGAHYRRLPVTNLDQYEMAGVYYAATDLEARACAWCPVLVVGGGNSAGQAAMFLAEHATSVCIAVRRPLAATMSSYLVDRINAHPRIAVHEDTTVAGLAGSPTLQQATLSSGDRPSRVDCTALFSFIGAEPNSGWLGDVATDEHGFVRTDHDLDRRRSRRGMARARPSAAPIRDQPPRTLRRRRPPRRFDEAGRRSSRRRLRRDPLRPPVPRPPALTSRGFA